jgi:hypothetical protein
MTDNMTKQIFFAITTTYLASHQGLRIKATSPGGESVTVKWVHKDSHAANHTAAARALATKLNWAGRWYRGALTKGLVFVSVPLNGADDDCAFTMVGITTMNAAQYRDSLAQLGLSQVAAAKLLGVSLRTSQAYALGESKVPTTVGLVLKYLKFWQILVMPGEEPIRDSIEELIKKLTAAHGLATRGEVKRYVLDLSHRWATQEEEKDQC